MFEPDLSDLERDVEASMRMFKKSQVGPAAEITPAQPRRILFVLDGSSQDESVAAAAAYVYRRLNVELFCLDASEPAPNQEDRAQEDRAQENRAAALQPDLAKAVALRPGEEPIYDEIMLAVESHSPDLVILPCPFGREFESVGSDSAGTVIDVLLSRCLVPMLVIRRSDQPLEQAAKEIMLVVGTESQSEFEAASWALAMALPGAELTLSLVIDREQYENMRSLLEVIAPDKPLDISQLNEAMTESHARLHAAISKSASAKKLKYRLQPMAYEDAPPSVLYAARPLLVVLPSEVDDRYSNGFVQDRIRRSPHPVLVVPHDG